MLLAGMLDEIMVDEMEYTLVYSKEIDWVDDLDEMKVVQVVVLMAA